MIRSMRHGFSCKLEHVRMFNFSNYTSDVKKVSFSFKILHIRQNSRSKNVGYVVLENWKNFLKRFTLKNVSGNGNEIYHPRANAFAKSDVSWFFEVIGWWGAPPIYHCSVKFTSCSILVRSGAGDEFHNAIDQFFEIISVITYLKAF